MLTKRELSFIEDSSVFMSLERDIWDLKSSHRDAAVSSRGEVSPKEELWDERLLGDVWRERSNFEDGVMGTCSLEGEEGRAF